ncbi:hypothetical protein [uncultured Ruthenibacterium sp.]|uniref:hypothetical protein n=1 Tax=uncultured Ruthenibacterium sp. TaxID=1905347 RepID=UPI00349ECCE9
MAMTANILLLLVVIPIVLIEIFVALCFLERALARKKAWWPGLILPGLALLGALFFSLNYSASADSTSVLMLIGSIGGVFLLANLPTYIFLLIYGVVRSKDKKRREMDKMNIQDL